MNNSIIYIIVLVALFITASTLGAALAKMRSRKSVQYDERQTAAQGQATRASYFTLMALLCAYAVYDMAAENSAVPVPVGVFTCIALSVAVYAIICIMKDAYVAISGGGGLQIGIFAVIAAANLTSGISHIIGGSIMEDGVLQPQIISFVVGLLAAVVAVALAVRFAIQKKQVTQEDGEDE